MNQTCINEAKNLKLSDPELSTAWCSSTFLTTFLFNPEGRRQWNWTPQCPEMLMLLIMSRYNQKKTTKKTPDDPFISSL